MDYRWLHRHSGVLHFWRSPSICVSVKAFTIDQANVVCSDVCSVGASD